LPFLPSRFFFCAVAARSDFERLLAFERGKHRSGFCLFFDVPHSPAILPELSIRTQSWLRHLASSPATFLPLRFFGVVWVFTILRRSHVCISRRVSVECALRPSLACGTYFAALTFRRGLLGLARIGHQKNLSAKAEAIIKAAIPQRRISSLSSCASIFA